VAMVGGAAVGIAVAFMSFLLKRSVPQTTNTDEPVVLRDSRSRCACAASSSR
jgi:hypothetical protein